MKISRRGFMKTLGGTAAGAAAGARAERSLASTLPAGERFPGAVATTSICPYCAVGCGMIARARDGKLVQVTGDPDHPINQGALCSKGAALLQTATSPGRLKKVLYRAPGSAEWEEKSWDWALPRIAERIQKTRDATFVAEKNGNTVNRTEGIACLGGASLDNEECYLYVKLARALGIVFVEHQARI